MAIVKAVSSGASLGRIMAYIDKEDSITAGKDCYDDRKHALEEMRITKKCWDKCDGRQYKHYIQSFSPEESQKVSAKTINEIGQKWAKQNFPNHEVFISTHTDKGHYHNHFVVNSVNYSNGKKINFNKNALEKFKNVSDTICKEYGLSVIDKEKSIERGEVRTYDMNKYQCIAQEKSYLVKAAIKINDALYKSERPQEFIYNMQKDGYKVAWSNNRKHITLTTPEGKKIRTSNLAKTFNEPKFTKEGMINEFVQKQNDKYKYCEQKIAREQRTEVDRYQRSIENNGFDGEARSYEIREYDDEKSIRDIKRKLQNIKGRTIGKINGNEEFDTRNTGNYKTQSDIKRKNKGRCR